MSMSTFCHVNHPQTRILNTWLMTWPLSSCCRSTVACCHPTKYSIRYGGLYRHCCVYLITAFGFFRALDMRVIAWKKEKRITQQKNAQQAPCTHSITHPGRAAACFALAILTVLDPCCSYNFLREKLYPFAFLAGIRAKLRLNFQGTHECRAVFDIS